MSSQQQALAPRGGVLDAVEKAKPQLMARLPEGMTQDRFVFGLLTAIQKNPQLQQCDPKSVILAAYEAAECGCDLSPSRAMGWLIPYKNVAQFQPSYRHFIQLAYKSESVRAFNAEVVYSTDTFKITFAPRRNIVHQPTSLDKRGTPVGAYALIEFVDGHIDFEFLTHDQIEQHRAKSKAPDSLMWKEFWAEGARKTAIRVLSKRLPQTNPAMDKLAELVQRDADADTGEQPSGVLELAVNSPLAQPAANKQVAKEVVAQPEITFHVGKVLTYVYGQTRSIEPGLRSMYARRDEDKKAWTIPASDTDGLVTLCELKNVKYVEIGEDGQALKTVQQRVLDDSDSQDWHHPQQQSEQDFELR